MERYTSELSGGQQQRVAIARVLIMSLRFSVDLFVESRCDTANGDAGRTQATASRDRGDHNLRHTRSAEALTMSSHIALLESGSFSNSRLLEIYSGPPIDLPPIFSSPRPICRLPWIRTR